MTEHRACECGNLRQLEVIDFPSVRYPGRIEAAVHCLSCGRRGASGYSRYKYGAIARAWKWWDAGVVNRSGSKNTN